MDTVVCHLVSINRDRAICEVLRVLPPPVHIPRLAHQADWVGEDLRVGLTVYRTV